MSRLLKEERIKELIARGLYNNELINDEVYEKCGKPKILSNLPYDLRTNDKIKLQNRLDKATDLLRDNQDKFKEKNKEYDKVNKQFKSLEKKIKEDKNEIEKTFNNIYKLTDKGRDYWDDRINVSMASLNKPKLNKVKKAWKTLYDITHEGKSDKFLENIDKLLDGEDVPLKKFVGRGGISEITNNILNSTGELIDVSTVDLDIGNFNTNMGRVSKNIPNYKKKFEELDKLDDECANLEMNIDDLNSEITIIKQKINE